ncbi:universal stress protein [Nocardia sp. CDC153]|uniref:universal stress protein n=1 Tax=Nocardia sp. CDC153 TaxID=3112167 RepID=UPI002DBED6FE|nr:universal stress protein [Nocardia sp. CDC153]MEC3957921.1 universal stress protein [Nocardia sp. CDC153]
MTERDYDDPHTLASAEVVVGVDGSPGAAIALRWAADYAVRHGRALRIVNGLNLAGTSSAAGPYTVITPQIIDIARAQGRSLLRHASESVRASHPDLRITTHMTADTAAALLIAESAEANTVVLGATGSVGTLGHLGSTLLGVTAHAQGSVIVVRPDPEADGAVHETGPVVVGIDGSKVSEPAIAAAFAEASERGAELIAVHVWSDWNAGTFAGQFPEPGLDELEGVEEALLAERLAGWREKYPDVPVQQRVYFTSPSAQLLEWSKHAQLVVVGNRGRGGFLGMLLGSTAFALVQHGQCPVMVVHAAE